MNLWHLRKMLLLKLQQFYLVTLVLYLILTIFVCKNNSTSLVDILHDENTDLTYIVSAYSRRILTHKKNALKTTIKQKEHERRKKEEEEREEKRRLFFVQNLEARLVASSVLRDFYAGRF